MGDTDNVVVPHIEKVQSKMVKRGVVRARIRTRQTVLERFVGLILLIAQTLFLRNRKWT